MELNEFFLSFYFPSKSYGWRNQYSCITCKFKKNQEKIPFLSLDLCRCQLRSKSTITNMITMIFNCRGSIPGLGQMCTASPYFKVSNIKQRIDRMIIIIVRKQPSYFAVWTSSSAEVLLYVSIMSF